MKNLGEEAEDVGSFRGGLAQDDQGPPPGGTRQMVGVPAQTKFIIGVTSEQIQIIFLFFTRNLLFAYE